MDGFALLTEEERSLEFSLWPVSTAVFVGPLDLLLFLARRHRLPVTEVSLAAVSDQFLEFIYSTTDLDADQAAEFLVVAATLLSTKARLLLPREQAEEEAQQEEEIPSAEQLAQRVEELARLRACAVRLAERFEQRRFLMSRGSAPDDGQGRLVEVTSVSLGDLASAFQQIMERAKPRPAVIEPERVSMRAALRRLAALVSQAQHPLPLAELVGESPTRLEVIVCFLALLELIRRGRAVVVQERLFGEIKVCSPALLAAGERASGREHRGVQSRR